MHHRAAGKIQHPHFEQQAVGVPGHVRERAINQQGKQTNKNDIAPKTHPLGKRAGDECRGDDGEFQLEGCEQHKGQTRTDPVVRGQPHVVEEKEGSRIADDAANVVAKRQAEAHHIPDEAHDAQCHKTLQHGGNDAPGIDHAAVKKRKAGRHQQYQSGSRKHEGKRAGIESAAFGMSRRVEGRQAGKGDKNAKDEKRNVAAVVSCFVGKSCHVTKDAGQGEPSVRLFTPGFVNRGKYG